MGLSTFLFVSYKTLKHGAPFILRCLGRISRILSPIATYLSKTRIIGPLLSAVIRCGFFLGFVVLLMSDHLVRAVLRRFAGQHPTKRDYCAMDPVINMFDDSIPPTKSLESGDQFKMRKRLCEQQGDDVNAVMDLIKRPRYSLSLAYTVAVASKLVYEDIAVIKYELEKAGFDVENTFKPIAYKNICAFIVEKNDDILLVFRGTNPLNMQNYVTNINARMGEIKAPWGPMGKVHKGFWDAMGDPIPRRKESRSHPEPEEPPSTLRIELNSASLYRTIASTVQAAIKIIKFLTLNLFHHVAEPVDSSWIGPDIDIRTRSMYAMAEKYILELIAKDGGHMADAEVPTTKEMRRRSDQSNSSGEQKIRKKRLFITGHSLGGALGTIFLAKMLQSKSPLLEHFAGLYTFGQPKIGDAGFSKIFDPKLSSKIFHHAYNNDIVPRVPTWSKYETPPGTLVFIDSAYNITIYPPNPYTNEPVPVRPISFLHLSGLLNRYVIRRLPRETFVRLIFRVLCPFFMNDHFPSDYCASLRQGTVKWVIMGTGGFHGGEDKERSAEARAHRRFSIVNVENHSPKH
ncbi:Alpha/Beta hydrolase protein [Radiomyces spectabilis]|uniref:Alpha/Beta hydrolase protein n=1 Tax=Radiomyces spectabilis TaxID=64574 RepID=UPI002220943F|nr:Alpha/Beta hydrolase protein [Radiomyces spectabilis]KAI8364760.1 Alpha/Beta hydrolase protein [Radiomyces spectabilis]